MSKSYTRRAGYGHYAFWNTDGALLSASRSPPEPTLGAHPMDPGNQTPCKTGLRWVDLTRCPKSTLTPANLSIRPHPKRSGPSERATPPRRKTNLRTHGLRAFRSTPQGPGAWLGWRCALAACKRAVGPLQFDAEGRTKAETAWQSPKQKPTVLLTRSCSIYNRGSAGWRHRLAGSLPLSHSPLEPVLGAHPTMDPGRATGKTGPFQGFSYYTLGLRPLRNHPILF